MLKRILITTQAHFARNLKKPIVSDPVPSTNALFPSDEEIEQKLGKSPKQGLTF